MTVTQKFNAGHYDAATLAEWGPLGITEHTPAGTPIYWHSEDGQLMKDIGGVRVNIDGTIDLLPFLHVTTEELEILRGAGFDAFTTAPTKKNAWTRHKSKHGVSWTCVVAISLDAGHSIAEAIRAHESADYRRDNEIFSLD